MSLSSKSNTISKFLGAVMCVGVLAALTALVPTSPSSDVAGKRPAPAPAATPTQTAMAR